jgi:aspartate racemase
MAASSAGPPPESGNTPEPETAENERTSDLAYVIYTSGTTGRPKGALITHANLAHYAQALSEALAISGDDVYLHTAAMGFSSSMRQWFIPLSLGARVVVASNDERRDPLALFELIRRERVSVIDLVPSHWRNCLHVLGALEATQRSTLLDNSVRLCLSASEPLSSDIPRTWLEDWKQPGRFVNMFGHTETCGIISTFQVPEGANDTALVPLGRPLSNTRIYLLDDRNEPVAWGEAGEVCVGGPGVGRGYLNRDDVTRRQFVADPFVAGGQGVIYRTGDLARYLPDGNLEYLSRRDQQIKIRGHRVEPAEIEAVLLGHERVRSCAVVLRGDSADDQQLVAYVVPRTLPAPSAEALRMYLSGLLPPYMVPATFVVLRELPTTPTGKLDRSALPAPAAVDLPTQSVRRATSGPVESALAGIWRSVLGVAEIGADDDFFDLGGHSLLATRLMTRVWNAFRVQLPLRTLFDSPTIAAFAKALIANEVRPGLTEKVARILVQNTESVGAVSETIQDRQKT